MKKINILYIRILVYIISLLLILTVLVYNGYLEPQPNNTIITSQFVSKFGNPENTTGEQQQTVSYTKSITINNSVVKNTLYPLIQINNNVSDVKVSFEVDFTDYFKQQYSSYINAPRYFFAFKFFLGDIDNGGFIDVFRNHYDGVSNSTNGDLNGAKLGQYINGGTQWSIGNEVKIAQPAGIYGFIRAYPTAYINSQVGKTIHIGGYLSSVQEMKGRNFTVIKSIKIEYKGTENAIQFKDEK